MDVVSGGQASRGGARSRRWLRRSLALALGCVLVELGWRVYLFGFAPPERLAKFARIDQMPPEAFRFRPHPYLAYALNETFTGADGLNRHNAHGCRGPDFAVPKPAGTFRIVCLGGSTTYETGVRADLDAYPARLEALLRSRGHGNVEVVNAGVPGYSSFESSLLLQLRVFEWQPDLVLYYDNTNDVHPRLVAPEFFASDNAGYRRAWDVETPWWDTSLAVRWLGVQAGFSPRNALVDRATWTDHEAGDKRAALAANGPAWFRRNVETMATLCAARGVELALTSWAWSPEKGDFASEAVYQRAFTEHNTVLAEVACARGLAWFDFQPKMPTDAVLWSDGAHVNEKGAQRKAELFAEFVEPLLAK